MKENNDYVHVVAEAMGISYDEAYRVMTEIEDHYGISFSEFATKKLFRYQGEALEKHAERTRKEKKKKTDYAIKVVAETTGWSIEETAAEMNRIKEKFGIGPRTYWFRQLYQMTDDQILEYKKKKNEAYNIRVKAVMEETGWTKDEVKDHMTYCKSHYNIHNSEYYTNFKCWTLSDAELKKLAVDEDSRRLSKRYNKKVSVLSNKFKFNQTFHDYLGRKYWVNRDTSFEEFLTFADGLEKIFCKPLKLSSGVGAKVIEIPKGKDKIQSLYNTLMAENEILAEEFIQQHEDMASMYPGSVNTIRLTMIKIDGQCHRLWSFARFGSSGIVDNFHGGGMAAAVDVETGEIITDAMNSNGQFFEVHPVTGKPFKGFQIPYWDKVKTITEQALLSQDVIGYVGWDIAICPDRVVLVEGNSTPQVGVYQSLLAPIGQKHLYRKFLKKKKK